MNIFYFLQILQGRENKVHNELSVIYLICRLCVSDMVTDGEDVDSDNAVSTYFHILRYFRKCCYSCMK